MLCVRQGGGVYVGLESRTFEGGGGLKPSHTVTRGRGESKIGKKGVTYFVSGPLAIRQTFELGKFINTAGKSILKLVKIVKFG